MLGISHRASNSSDLWGLLDREESLTQRLGHGYLLALSLVAFLSVSGLVIIRGVLAKHTADGDLINLAGRQRMLSQKVSKLALALDSGLLTTGTGPAVLRSSVAEWRDAHASLSARPNDRFPTPNSADLTRRFASVEVHLEAMAQAALSLATAVEAGETPVQRLSPTLASILAHEGPFLAEMESIVALIEADSMKFVAMIGDIELGLMAATLITLLLEALLIFRPALSLLAQTQRRLRGALQALAASERSKSALLEAVPDVVLQVDRGRRVRLAHVPDGVDLPALHAASVGMPIDAALTPAAAGELGARITATRELETTQCFEVTLPGRAGERRFEARVALAGLDDVLVLLRDVTEQRWLEREVVNIASSERRRIGHDLHDGLCQHLAGLSLLVGSLMHKARASGAMSVDAAVLEQLGELIERALQESRQIARTLHPIALEVDGLASALAELARSLTTLYGVPCVAEVDAETWQPPIATATELYRIAQEATSNAARHSGAGTIAVRLAQSGDRLQLTVHDDGIGFDRTHPAGKSNGMGLRIMEHRARVIGAWLRIDSIESVGTTVNCELIASPAPIA